MLGSKIKSNKIYFTRHLQFFLVVFLAFISLGAWWQFGKEKSKDSQSEKKEVSQPLSLVSKQNVEIRQGQPLEQKQEGSEKGAEAASMLEASKSTKQSEDVKEIQNELRQVIKQTNRLQGIVRNNRVEVQQILERAKIHDKILRSISVPAPVRSTQQINTEEIIRREKLRLIAEQARKSQEQLRTIKLTRSSIQTHGPAIPSAKTSETS